MTTTNVTLTKDWTKIVNDGDQFFFTIPYQARGRLVEIATSDGEPTVVGHRLIGNLREGMSRTLLGPGDVYARATAEDTLAVVTIWSL